MRGDVLNHSHFSLWRAGTLCASRPVLFGSDKPNKHDHLLKQQQNNEMNGKKNIIRW